MKGNVQMMDINDAGLFGAKTEPRDDKIERLARECERKTILLALKQCRTLKDYKEFTAKLEALTEYQ